ncbi:sensor histidine kinase [Rhizohabitans arisaemae]|uniref:sensor histidine kinase n=1 Tax=Rhizohabitans arisaemae TaxID=2720610 RepID=UPI0024B04787|nr:histidine kinase [Rhizohabitans arisaemae]
MPSHTSARKLAGDVLLACAVGAVGVASDLVISGVVPLVPVPDFPWRGVLIQVIAAALLLVRRSHPLQVALLTIPLAYLEAPVAVPFALYSLGAHLGRRRLLIGVAAVTMLAMSRVWEAQTLATAIQLISVSGLFTIPATLLGLYIDSTRRLNRALAERAERAEAEQRLRIEQARAEERTRLAREMHDVVTHHVSLMVLQAGSLRMSAPTKEVRRAAEELRATGRRALDELREVVGVLHDAEPVELAPQPTLVDLSRLVAESGVAAELTQDDGITVSAALGRTAYRVVQEALTNARKHAPGAPVRVRVSRDGAGLRVSVSNPAAPRESRPVMPPSSRTGLLGLRQRVELVGGAFHAAPTPEGGFELTASLPAVTR